MLHAYKAMLKGNRLEWSGAAPEISTTNEAVAVQVIILDEATPLPGSVSQGERMAAALEQLAMVHTLATIVDPLTWEREVRQDRELPDRDA